MSEENVELTYRAIDAFNRRDLAAYLALMDPEGEFTAYEVSVQGGSPYRGQFVWWCAFGSEVEALGAAAGSD
jgi:hypothetical protein